MKNLKFILSFALLLTFSATNFAGEANRELPANGDEIVMSHMYEIVTETNEEFGRDCTVNVDVTLDDGTVITGTIVISDISWIRCAAIHIADFFSSAF